MITMTQTGGPAPSAGALGDELRDGLLQDLVAVGLILRHLEESLSEDAARSSLAAAARAIDDDVRAVRGIIDRLRTTPGGEAAA